jgi:hypothetical protein
MQVDSFRVRPDPAARNVTGFREADVFIGDKDGKNFEPFCRTDNLLLDWSRACIGIHPESHHISIGLAASASRCRLSQRKLNKCKIRSLTHMPTNRTTGRLTISG